MKIMRTLFQKEMWIKGILGVAAMLVLFTFNGFISKAAEGKVIPDTAKIRSEASTSSEVVGSTTKGKTVDIVGAVKDSSGTVWYKVPIANGGYGYIRSDLIETTDEIKVETTSSTASSADTTSTDKPAETVPTSIGETQAYISVDSAKIRSGASTAHDIVTSLSKDTVITLIGEATDSAGKKWYQMTCNKNGNTVEGYVRSDLVTIGEASASETTENGEGSTDDSTEGQEGEETADEAIEEIEEQQEPVEVEHNDYEVVYNDETYWLYDNTNGTMMSVTNLLDVVNQANESNGLLQNQVKNEKIAIIILAVVIVILVIILTVLLFKLKDAYYYEEYEEEEEEDEAFEEQQPPKKKKGKEDIPEETEKSVKVSAKPQAELQAAEERKPDKKPSKRKSQNFLIDDDEFEFEFLNMDDKDL